MVSSRAPLGAWFPGGCQGYGVLSRRTVWTRASGSVLFLLAVTQDVLRAPIGAWFFRAVGQVTETWSGWTADTRPPGMAVGQAEGLPQGHTGRSGAWSSWSLVDVVGTSDSISSSKLTVMSLFLQTPPGSKPALNTVLDKWLPWLCGGPGAIESIQVIIATMTLTYLASNPLLVCEGLDGIFNATCLT